MNCKKCGKEIDKKAVICPGCGCKIKKPFYKKWWFWAIVAVVVIASVSSSGDEDKSVTEPNVAVESEATASGDATAKTEKAEEIAYEVVDLQGMFDALEENAMKAEKNYQNKNIEFVCKINSFDSDGHYISVEPTNASEWNFITATCNIKNDTQRDFLIEKNVGDTITIRGKVKSIGEVLGYTVDIKEVF